MCVSVVGIVTNYGLDDPVFDHWQRQEVSVLSKNVHSGSEAHEASHWKHTGFLSRSAKRPELDADRTAPSSAEVKNEWSSTYASSRRLHGVVAPAQKRKKTPYFLVELTNQWKNLHAALCGDSAQICVHFCL